VLALVLPLPLDVDVELSFSSLEEWDEKEDKSDELRLMRPE